MCADIQKDNTTLQNKTVTWEKKETENITQIKIEWVVFYQDVYYVLLSNARLKETQEFKTCYMREVAASFNYG